MVCLQKVGEIGARNSMPERGALYTDHYKRDGRGLWIFDPVKREWSVSRTNRLALNHLGTAVRPSEPDWVYVVTQAGEFRAVNWRTEEVRTLEQAPRAMNSSYAGLEYWPDAEALIAFPRNKADENVNRVVCTYDLVARKWSTREVQGQAPKTYDINVVYDARNRVFVCFTDGFHYWYSPPENRWYKGSQKLADELTSRIKHRHAYDPVNNVHIVVADRWKTFAFKLAESPARLPTTRPH